MSSGTDSPTFVFAQGHSYLNKGDAGIILGMITDVRDEFPEAEIILVSFTPDVDSERFPDDIMVIKSPFRKIYSEDSLLRKYLLFALMPLIFLIGYLSRYSTIVSNICPWEIIRAYQTADAILLCGGDKFKDLRPDFVRAVEGLPEIAEGILAHFEGVPLMVYAHSGGPFMNPYRNHIFRWLFDKSSVITAREPISQEYFEQIVPGVRLTGDAAFSFQGSDEVSAREILSEAGIDPGGSIAGMTVREWSFPESDKNKTKAMEDYLSSIRSSATELVNRDFQVVIFPQVIGPGTDDRVISKTVCDEIDGVKCLDGDYSVSVLRSLIGRSDIFLGTRMHSNIFALSNNVPVVAIAYRHKTTGIMRMLDMGDYVVPIEELSGDTPEPLFDIIENKNQIRKQLEEKIPGMRDMSRYNAELIRNIVLR